MRLEAAVGSALFTAGVLCSAAFGHEIVHGLNRRHAHLHLQLKRDAEPTPTLKLVKRNDVFKAKVWPTVDIPAGFTLAGGVEVTPIAILATESMGGSAVLSTAIAAATPAMDPSTWNKQADLRCQDAIGRLNGTASNPSGMAACYNVPFLDPVKGTFEAELRIYNVSMPTGEFAGLSASSMYVTFQYNSASLQSSDGTLPVKRSLEERQIPPQAVPGQQGVGVYQASEISVRKYIGLVNKSAFTPNMNQSDFKTLLIPQITITAINPAAGKNITTPISPTEASFVVGLFMGATGSLTDPAFLLDKPAQKIEAAAQGLPTPFIVPGLSLGVFPVGLIITSTWMLFFGLIVGLGTLGRLKFREQYRRDFKVSMMAPGKRI